MRFYSNEATIDHVVVHLNTTLNSQVANPVTSSRALLPFVVERLSTNQLAVLIPQYSPLTARLVTPDNGTSATDATLGAVYPYSSNVILQKGTLVNNTSNFGADMSR